MRQLAQIVDNMIAGLAARDAEIAELKASIGELEEIVSDLERNRNLMQPVVDAAPDAKGGK